MINAGHLDVFGARNMRGEIAAALDRHCDVATAMEHQRRNAYSREQVAYIKRVGSTLQ